LLVEAAHLSRYANCPCDTKSLYHKCCGRYHAGAIAPTALDLMRSRYSAYTLGHADYIMDTTHPEHPQYQTDRNLWKADIELFCHETRFLFLKILEFIDGDTTAYVSFTANLQQNNENATFTEKSTFVKENGKWLYKAGDTLTDTT
jgi:SEC-C motif domain protein